MKTFAKISVVRKSLRSESELEKGSMGETNGGFSDTNIGISSTRRCPYGTYRYSCPYVNVDYSAPCPCVVSLYSSPDCDQDISAEKSAL
ncbi:MAG: hypothetical protein GY765_34695 [bacterium]|nr:hypothetical protein [bacterium]